MGNLYSANNDALFRQAVESGNTSRVQELLNEGVNINLKFKGLSPLHRACYEGHIGVVRLLVEHGADVNTKNSNGWTPLQVSCSMDMDRLEIAKILIQNGADLDSKSNDGETALHESCCFGRWLATKLLMVENGADVNARCKDETTPLHKACRNPWRDSFEIT